MDDRTLEGAGAVPLEEQLRSVPKDAREMVEIGYCSHRNIPYGRMCHEAADAITELRAEIARLESVPTSAEIAALCTFGLGYQRQVDDDGHLIAVSRQGVDEAIVELCSLSRQVAERDAEIESLRAECGLRQIQGYNEGKQKAATAIATLRADIAGLRRGVPYREFCSQPAKCAGLGSCPRDPCCAD
jgi:hypothetical protein